MVTEFYTPKGSPPTQPIKIRATFFKGDTRITCLLLYNNICINIFRHYVIQVVYLFLNNFTCLRDTGLVITKRSRV
jgi:hypothetical protein